MERLTRKVEGTETRPPYYVAVNGTNNWVLVQRLGDLEDKQEGPKSIKIRILELIYVYKALMAEFEASDEIDILGCIEFVQPPYDESTLRMVGILHPEASSAEDIADFLEAIETA